MWNTEENGKYTIKLKKLAEGILLHKQSLLEQLCHTSMVWKINGNYGKKPELLNIINNLYGIYKEEDKYKLLLKDIYNLRLSEELVQSNCIVEINYIKSVEGEKKTAYELLVTFVKGKVAFINIMELKNEQAERIYRIRSTKEKCFLVREREVLYIEACHNQVIWHCVDKIIISNNSLGHLEEQISKTFVRIQRGYLVNKKNVRHIRRCEVEMNNGDILSIPCKKYVGIREKLFDIEEKVYK